MGVEAIYKNVKVSLEWIGEADSAGEPLMRMFGFVFDDGSWKYIEEPFGVSTCTMISANGSKRSLTSKALSLAKELYTKISTGGVIKDWVEGISYME